jgi:putative ATPase
MTKPLATVLRPLTLAEFIGQEDLVGEHGPIRRMLDSGQAASMIFWGPPASGKTTLARIIAQSVKADFLELSAVMDGKDELKRVLSQAKRNLDYDQQTVLFIDEIHRWNKAQQDALLPHVESGDIILVGATTENPSFEIIAPLLSRTRVFIFKPHTQANILTGLERGIKYLSQHTDLKDANKTASGQTDELNYLAGISDGDMRFALNSLEIAWQMSQGQITQTVIQQATQKFLRYDKNGEEHYNIISAVHKSLRSSNPTAGVYWVTRMLEAGEDPLYIARRLVRFASEDIGNSNPNALLLANQVFEACRNLGMPECGVHLAQLAQYLANSPKDNSAYKAYQQAQADVKKFGALPVPLHLRNAPTKLMKDLKYGHGYEYDHDLEGKKSDQQTMPEELADRNYFET